jgi:outer membrane protein OmpA-like peptidoglycan-associated protein
MKSVSRLLAIIGVALTFGAALSSAHAQDQDYPVQHFIDARTVTAMHHLNRIAVAEPVQAEMVVNFDTNSSMLNPVAEKQVAKIATVLKSHPGHYVIHGYTDSKGNVAHNQKLSYHRALTVMHALVKKYGIPAGTLSAEGSGEADPVATNSTPEGRAANRRVSVTPAM